MRAILLGPVRVSDRDQRQLIRSLKITADDCLIGVDGGTWAWKKFGYTPHFAVGDWDSLPWVETLGEKASLLTYLPHVTLPRGKQRSDLFFSCVAAIEAGAKHLVCLGVTGARPDHHLASLFDLSNFSAGRYGELESVEALGAEAQYYFLSEKIPFWKGKLSVGSTVSVFTMGARASGVTLSGFQYGLKEATLLPSSLGLSNRTLKRKIEVRLRKGRLLVIIPPDVQVET